MAKNEVKNSRGFARKAMAMTLRIAVMPRFLKVAGLVVLFFFFVIASDVMASSNDYYTIRDCDNSVIFSINKGANFVATDADAFRPKVMSTEHFKLLLGVRSIVEGMKIWDSTLFPKLREALRNDPWVESTSSISRWYPHYVHITLKLRTPFAYVGWKGHQYIVDRSSVLLPIQPDSDIGIHLVRIDGVRGGPPIKPGEKWETSYVEDCVGLLDYLTRNLVEKSTFINLFAIVEKMECAPANQTLKTGKPAITLRLIGGGAIVWDMYFAEERAFGRPGREQKLRNLKEALVKINDINAIEIIDLSYEAATVKFKGSGNVR